MVETSSAVSMILVGHFVGDVIVQTDWQAANKMKSWKANQAHALGYHISLGAFALLAMQPRKVLSLVFVSWVTHSFIDRKWPVKWLMRKTGSAEFAETVWGPIAVDQALHISILCITEQLLNKQIQKEG